jgi:hypothetical protein
MINDNHFGERMDPEARNSQDYEASALNASQTQNAYIMPSLYQESMFPELKQLSSNDQSALMVFDQTYIGSALNESLDNNMNMHLD